MEISCEFFMDYAYDEDTVATEMIKPIQGIVNVIQKIISALQRLLNNFKKLRKVYVPKALMKPYETINESIIRLEEFLDKTLAGNIEEDKVKLAEDILETLDTVKSSDEFALFMGSEKRDSNAFKEDYEEKNSKELVNELNKAIAKMSKFRGEVNKVYGNQVDPDTKKLFSAVMQFYQMKINVYNKLFTFRRPFRDPKNVERLEEPIQATVYV